MASKYAKRMVVPDGFAELLKHFTGEALRDLPPDIPDDACEEWLLNYGAQFFEAAAEESRAAYGDAGGGGGSTAELARALEAMGPDELRDRITAIFLDADRDGNGFLDAREFKEVVKSFASELGLPLTDVRRIMAEADENADGCIEYHEFVPMAVDIIQMLIAKNKFEESKKAREEDAVTQSRHFLLHGMSGDDLEAVLQEMFRQADVDGSGELSRKEFSKALRESGLGLTRKEINVLLAEVDANEDGMVSYAEFLPLCFNLLVEIVSEEFQSASTPSNEVEIRDFFTDLFRSADAENTGYLPPHELSALLRGADLGLTHVQISALMSEAAVEESGLVRYVTFAQDAATVVSAIVTVQTTQEQAERLQELRSSGAGATVMGMGADEFQGALAGALGSADMDGSGRVLLADAHAILTSDAVGLDDKATYAILSMAAPDADMTVDIVTLASNAFAVLQQIQENSTITQW